MTDFGKVKEPARIRVLDLLSDLEWHSWSELKDVGGVRYSARIHELRRQGYEIKVSPIEGTTGNRYRLVSKVPGSPVTKKVKLFLSDGDVSSILSHLKHRPGLLSDDGATECRRALASFERNRGKL